MRRLILVANSYTTEETIYLQLQHKGRKLRVLVNDRDMELEGALTLKQLLQRLGLEEGRPVAVAVNGTLIPKRDRESLQLNGGEDIQIVHVVGGG